MNKQDILNSITPGQVDDLSQVYRQNGYIKVLEVISQYMQDLPPDTPKKQMTVLDMQGYITRKLGSAKLVRGEKTYKQNQNIKEAESKSIY